MKISRHFIILLFVIAAISSVVFWKIPKSEISTISGSQIVHQPKTTTLFFAGDIMLSRNVAAKMYEANDFTLPFANVADKISRADLSFANLESPFNDSGVHSIEGSLVFNADPQAIAGLKFAGFDVLSTANNHGFDQGQKGIDFTKTLLSQNQILPVGTGVDCHDGIIVAKNGIKFGFLAYSYTALNDGGKTTSPQVCDANNLAQLKIDIQNLKPLVDVMVVSTHMGIEYTRTPSESQIKFAHASIDAGADLIIGNHPHWAQTIEQYQGKWIFYAMGNLVFDQMWSTETREGLTAQIYFKDKTLDKIELMPVVIDDFCCPRWANEEETKNILQKIKRLILRTQLYSKIGQNFLLTFVRISFIGTLIFCAQFDKPFAFQHN
jgi:poly-gamma-glutamate capsule biosynthesis protein CapA/YwtB (metallophosphatase superfamily)